MRRKEFCSIPCESLRVQTVRIVTVDGTWTMLWNLGMKQQILALEEA
jgi:hypothetical protein